MKTPRCCHRRPNGCRWSQPVPRAACQFQHWYCRVPCLYLCRSSWRASRCPPTHWRQPRQHQVWRFLRDHFGAWASAPTSRAPWVPFFRIVVHQTCHWACLLVRGKVCVAGSIAAHARGASTDQPTSAGAAAQHGVDESLGVMDAAALLAAVDWDAAQLRDSFRLLTASLQEAVGQAAGATLDHVLLYQDVAERLQVPLLPLPVLRFGRPCICFVPSCCCMWALHSGWGHCVAVATPLSLGCAGT